MNTALHPILDALNDPQRLRALDPHAMLGLVRAFPTQCREAVAFGKEWGPEPTARTEREVRQIVVTGLGGSAIGADYARCLMEAYGSVPLLVNRDYTLPHFVGPHTLVIAMSYSGNTEETLAAYAAAKEAQAQIAVVTSGGKLHALAQADGHPFCLVPGGQPPRSATGYMFFPLIGYLTQRGLLERDLTGDIEETLGRLDSVADTLGPDLPTPSNPAKQMALALQGKLPVVYGSQGYRGAVAVRWKGQFNENSKQAGFANVFPEQNHNEILAWVLAPKQAQNWAVLFLRDPGEAAAQPRIAQRIEVTKRLIASAAQVHEVWAEGTSLLARIFSLHHFADYLTVYMAYLNGVCPTDIGSIDHLKAEMEKLA